MLVSGMMGVHNVNLSSTRASPFKPPTSGTSCCSSCLEFWDHVYRSVVRREHACMPHLRTEYGPAHKKYSKMLFRLSLARLMPISWRKRTNI
jgi:hypothetical protein